MNGFELLAAVACGAFIPAAFAGEINDGFSGLMRHLMGRAYSDAWLGSAETGVVEELLKLGTVALLVYLFSRKSRQDYLSIGMSVGMGFQIEEDFSYITESGFKHVSEAFPTALDRIVGALGSHWAYTGLTAVGLYLIVCSRGDHHVRQGVFWDGESFSVRLADWQCEPLQRAADGGCALARDRLFKRLRRKTRRQGSRQRVRRI